MKQCKQYGEISQDNGALTRDNYNRKDNPGRLCIARIQTVSETVFDNSREVAEKR
jgi:hypothetical protein